MATMAVRPIFDNTVSLEANQLLADARMLCDSLNPDQSIVLIELGKAKADTLTRLCEKMDVSARPAVESLLQKAQKKLALAERVSQYQRVAYENKSIDPRIEKILPKLALMSTNPPVPAAAFVKLDKWRSKLYRFHLGNTITLETLIKARKTICELDMEFLKKSPQIVHMGLSIHHGPTTQHFSALPNPGKGLIQSSVAYAIFYLNSILKHQDSRAQSMVIDPFILNGGRELAQLIEEKKPEWRISEQEVIQALAQTYSHIAIAAVDSPEISYLPGANQQEIESQLQALIDLKPNHLKSMGAFVGIAHQTLAMVFRSTGRISLYNPCGDSKREFSYEVNFSSVEQAAEYLKELTDEFHAIPPITLKPYGQLAALVQPKNFPSAPLGFTPPPSSGPPFPFPGPTAPGAPFSINSPQPPRRGTPYPSYRVLPSPPMHYSTGPHSPFVTSTSSAMPTPPPFPWSMPSMPGIPFQPSSASSPINPNSRRGFEFTRLESDDEEVDDDTDVEYPTLNKLFPGISSIKESIQALSQRNEEGFFQSLPHLDKLKDDEWLWVDGSEGSALNRVYFHLYHIQDKETPDQIDRYDHTWGMTAFQTEELSTPDQKLRAVQRVHLEILLLSLEDVIEQDHGTENFVQLLDELEELKLNQSDLPSGQTNAAHALFGKFYQVYIKARENDSSLDDLHHEKFQGNFGRCAFRGDFEIEIADEIKIAALKELGKDLKTAWRIQ